MSTVPLGRGEVVVMVNAVAEAQWLANKKHPRKESRKASRLGILDSRTNLVMCVI